jgi:hypothetical protein
VDNCQFDANPDQANHDRNFISNSPPYPPALNDFTRANSDAFGDLCDLDDDNDGLSDMIEVTLQPCPSASGATDPLVFDSDGDRYIDGIECTAGSDPANALGKPDASACGSAGDTDLDHLPDRLERCYYGTDPSMIDTDGDRSFGGAEDGCEATSLNRDRIVNSGDQIMLGAAIAGVYPYSPNVDVNKDGVLSSGDQSLMAAFILPHRCP